MATGVHCALRSLRTKNDPTGSQKSTNNHQLGDTQADEAECLFQLHDVVLIPQLGTFLPNAGGTPDVLYNSECSANAMVKL